VPLRWLDTGGCSLRQGASDVLSGMQMILGWWRGRAPSDSDGLTFGCCSVDDSLSWSHRRSERVIFEEDFLVLGERS